MTIDPIYLAAFVAVVALAAFGAGRLSRFAFGSREDVPPGEVWRRRDGE